MKCLLSFLKLRKAAFKEKKDIVIECLDECIFHAQNILLSEDLTSIYTRQSRLFIIRRFDTLTIDMSGYLTDLEMEKIRLAFVALRVYFHAASHESELDKQLEQDYQLRLDAFNNYLYPSEMWHRSSYEAYMKKLVVDKESEATMNNQQIENRIRAIKEVCLDEVQCLHDSRINWLARRHTILNTAV